jgi:hypothetical protein
MLEEDENLQIQEQEYRSMENLMFKNPGSTFLKIMEYYYEEKQYNYQATDLKIWELFIEKYFTTTVEMEVKIFENQKLFYKIGILYLKY